MEIFRKKHFWALNVQRISTFCLKIQNFTTFTGRDGTDGVDRQARVVNDPIDGEPALNVSAIAYNNNVWIKKVVSLDENGDTLRDESGEIIYEEEEVPIYIKENGDTLKNGDSYENAITDWQTQFFVTVPRKFTTGQQYKLVIWARADKPASIDTQAHTMPGSYVHWNFCGSLDLTEDWQCFEFGTDEDNPATIASEANGCQTIAFNCNKYKDEDNQYYFRFEESSFNTADIKDNERVLDSESLTMPLAAVKDGETKAEIDLSKAFETLEVQKMGNLTLKIQTEETFSDGVDLTAGANVDVNGWWTESMENSIGLEQNDDTTTDAVLGLTIVNGGLTLEAGQSVDTKLALENQTGWRYLYNVSFIDSEVYSGIEDTSFAPKANVVYDLMGRKISKAVKGLYIVNGKKYFVK